MSYVSFGKWTDVLIDFGREIYLPWAMTEGKILYSDIFYFRGALSPYFNYLLFKVFGVGLSTLVTANYVILIMILALIWFIAERSSSYLISFLSCLIFIFLFAFQYYLGVNIFNYIAPYSHESTHGILLSLIMIVCFACALFDERKFWLVLSGITLGLTFLTKPEIFLAAFSAFVAYLIVHSIFNDVKSAARQSLLILLSCAISILAFFFLLLTSWPLDIAMEGILGSWIYMTNQDLSSSAFSHRVMGLLNLSESLYIIFTGFFIYIVFAGLGIIACMSRFNWTIRFLSILIVVFTILCNTFIQEFYSVFDFAKPFPLIVLATGAALFFLAIKEKNAKAALSFVFCIFSFVLMGRIIFNVNLYHYGFYLAMPATMVMIMVLFYWIPETLKKYGHNPFIFYGISLLLITIISVQHVNISITRYNHKNVPVSAVPDFMLSDWRGLFINATIDWLSENTDDDSTVLVLPEGIMINYLARRVNSTPVVALLPPEVSMHGGEKHILSRIQKSPPDHIIFVHRDTEEYGYKYFGKDYGMLIHGWIMNHYELVVLFGYPPLQDGRFGVEIYKQI